jgi:hypothetical protein
MRDIAEFEHRSTHVAQTCQGKRANERLAIVCPSRQLPTRYRLMTLHYRRFCLIGAVGAAVATAWYALAHLPMPVEADHSSRAIGLRLSALLLPLLGTAFIIVMTAAISLIDRGRLNVPADQGTPSVFANARHRRVRRKRHGTRALGDRAGGAPERRPQRQLAEKSSRPLGTRLQTKCRET